MQEVDKVQIWKLRKVPSRKFNTNSLEIKTVLRSTATIHT